MKWRSKMWFAKEGDNVMIHPRVAFQSKVSEVYNEKDLLIARGLSHIIFTITAHRVETTNYGDAKNHYLFDSGAALESDEHFI